MTAYRHYIKWLPLTNKNRQKIENQVPIYVSDIFIKWSFYCMQPPQPSPPELPPLFNILPIRFLTMFFTLTA